MKKNYKDKYKTNKTNKNKQFSKNKATKKKKSLLNPIEKSILMFLRKDRETVFGSRELIRKLNFKDKDAFYSAIKNLEENGYIVVGSHKIKLNLDANEQEGEVVSLSLGFAFVRPENGGEDIFVHGSEMNGALVGDKVLLGNIKKDSKGYSGKIIRILTEGSDQTTGTVAKTPYGYELIPDNKLRYNPKLVELAGANIGDKVMAQLVQDARGDWTQAVVTKVFGSGESAKICSDAIIAQNGIATEFPQSCILEAQEISKSVITEEEIAKRLDLRDELIFTIDGADAKDLDDAISVKKLDDCWEIGVHIADVAHYIKKHSCIDDEAMNRGTSVYFADRVIPMLPKEISNGVCSLTVGTDKLCFSALITLSLDGDIKKYKFKKTIIHSKVRGVYSEVNEIFNGTASAEILEKYEPIKEVLNNARELADILKLKSKSRGAMEIESDESRFVLDKNGVCVGVMPRESGEAQELIEQFMISANVCAAKFSKDNKLPFLYRVHENPQASRIKELIDFLNSLGIDAKELRKEKPSTADFTKILNKIDDKDRKEIVSQRLLRTMEKAKYSVDALGHFGLNLKDYSHFTSPIRRYPDTSIHRVMTAFCEGMKSEDAEKTFRKFCEKSATQSSENEVKAVVAERQAEDCYMAEFMSQHLGESFSGKVSSVLKSGVFVKLENSIEGFVAMDRFVDNDFEFDGLITQKCRHSGRILTLGTKLDIIVAKTHVATGKIDFEPIV